MMMTTGYIVGESNYGLGDAFLYNFFMTMNF